MLPVFRTSRRVEFRDTDAAGLVHFSVLFNYMEEAEHEFLRHQGLSVLVSDEQGPISWPRVSAHCDFRGAVKFEDVVEVAVRIDRLGTKSITYGFTLTQEGRTIAEGQITSVCCRLSPNGLPQSIPIPVWIAEKLR